MSGAAPSAADGATRALTAEELDRVVATAVRAPSVHNTQPWRFDLDGDELHVRSDPTRRLPLGDPLGREMLISCGAAAVHAQLAVRGLGRRAHLTWSPTPDDVDHVATVTVSGPLEATAAELRLLDAVPLRRTDRTAYAPTAVPAALVTGLADAALQEGAHLTAEDRPDRVQLLQGLVARADSAQRHDGALQEETRAWVRDDRRPADGLPADALPDHGHGRGSSLALRDFDPDDGAPADGQEPPVAEHPLLLLLSTDTDTPRDWSRAGGALARVLLTATAAGLVVDPHTQVLEVPGQRWRLVAELGLTGSPQMLLRVGFPTGPGSPPSGRRPVSEVSSG